MKQIYIASFSILGAIIFGAVGAKSWTALEKWLSSEEMLSVIQSTALVANTLNEHSAPRMFSDMTNRIN